VAFSPTKKAGVCDQCGGEIYQRTDDQEETVAHRLRVYENQTAPLIEYYRQRNLLRELDGVGTVEEIRRRVVDALGDVAA
jgi:adenylate kinase